MGSQSYVVSCQSSELERMFSVFLPCLLSLLALSHCKPVSQPSPLTMSVGAVTRNLFLSLSESSEQRTANVVISPVSIWLALAMLHHGSASTTRSELERFLQLGPGGRALQTGPLLQDYAQRRAELNTTIQLANIMFADRSLPVRADYQQALQTNLKSQVRSVDFSQQFLAAEEINSWVENKTNHLITDFISPDILSPSTRLLVLNAIYFKANWKYPFLKFDTLNSVKFDVTEDSDVEVDMMAKSDTILYQSNKALQSDIVSLPYEDENFQMMVFLPHDNSDDSLQNLIQKFQSVDFNQIYGNLTESLVDLYLPKFSIGFKSELVSTLMNHGVRSMFNPDEADFSRISEETLRVSNVLHETRVEVTEEGSEAAGITGAVLDLRASVSHSHEVNVNRPFVFVIQDRKNNIPLFIGKVVNPSSEEPRRKKNSPDTENLIALRTPDLDLEDLAHFAENPQDFVDPKNCSKVEYINSEKVYFPCGADTEPIENYRRKHGDPSMLGINGEQAALVNI